MRTTVCRCVILAALLCSTACAGTIAPPSTAPSAPATEALLILPGFGYSEDGERALRALAPAMRAEGLDLHVPDYVKRSGLESSRENLRQFLRDHRLERYRRVHVFAFIAGGWTLNPLLEDAQLLPNLATVIYDRSPYQERAPRIAADRWPLLTWLRYGSAVSDLVREQYTALPRSGISVGLLVETEPTPFVKKYAKAAQSYGPYVFDCAAFNQPHNDCIFMALNHNELYVRFSEAWPDVRTFIRAGRFSAAADRTPPQEHMR